MTDSLRREPPQSDRQEPDEPVDLDTRKLFAGRTEIRIAHDNAVYRLRITRSGKLILNK